jgi:hypothetical protein
MMERRYPELGGTSREYEMSGQWKQHTVFPIQRRKWVTPNEKDCSNERAEVSSERQR